MTLSLGGRHLVDVCPCAPAARGSRGFTLIEALMAAAILAGAVLSLTWALAAGQANAAQGQTQVGAVLAAEEMMGQIVPNSYASLSGWGGMHTIDGYQIFVYVQTLTPNLPGVNVLVAGKDIQIYVKAANGENIVERHYFIPEPAS